MELNLVVFDIDGTLVDSEALILEGFAQTLSELGYPVPAPEAILSLIGLSLPEVMARLMPEADSATRERAIKAHRARFFAMRSDRGPASVPLFDGARESVEALAARPEILIGAATGMPRRGLDHVLEVHDLGRHFITRQTADLHPSKPHPAMLDAALRETGVEPAQAVMVGDTTYDIEMAVNAGVAGIGVSWGHHRAEDLGSAGARRVIDSFADLPGALEEIWRRA